MKIEILYILFLIFYPLIFAVFLYYAHKKSWLRLDHRSLFKQKLFWLSILIPCVTFLAFGGWSWWGRTPLLTADGFDEFLKISKLPLLFLAASVPLTAIINNIHRTIQTEKQIMESETKNRADSYYSHIKFQTDHFKSLPERTMTYEKNGVLYAKSIKISYPTSLYKKMYPLSDPINGANYESDRNHTKLILKSWVEINKILWELQKIEIKLISTNTESIKQTMELWHRAEVEIIKICDFTGIIYPSYPLSFSLRFSNKILISSMPSLKEMYSIIEALENICVGIVDSIGQMTLIEDRVFTKTEKLFSHREGNDELNFIMNNHCDYTTVEYSNPSLIVDGKRYLGIIAERWRQE